MSEKRIFTHSGLFHADDCMSVAICQLSGFSGDVIRVFQLPEDFGEDDIAVDVGGKNEGNIIDHHFKNGSIDDMAAVGKVWTRFGMTLCHNNQRVFDRVYLTLIGTIDRSDIAIQDWRPVREDWRHVSCSAMISMLNPPHGSTNAIQNICFELACKVMKQVLLNTIEYCEDFIEMSDIVSSSVRHFNGKVLELSKPGQWQEHVFNQKLDDVLYTIYKSERGGFCLQAVPDAPGSFGMRKPLPERLKGLRGAELNTALGGTFQETAALFIHPGKFIGGCETLEETLRLAEIALAE